MYTYKNKPQAYALYAFIDPATLDKYDVNRINNEPRLLTVHKGIKALIDYAFKTYFGMDVTDNPKRRNGGMGCIDGVYFSASLCLCGFCVAVSEQPIGISMRVAFPMEDRDGFARYNFCDNEYAEYLKNEYGDDTVFYMLCRKRAFENMNGCIFEDCKHMDSTVQPFTLHRAEFGGHAYLYAVTDAAEFIQTDISLLL